MTGMVGRFLNYLLVPLYTARISAASGGYGTITNIRDENTVTLAIGPQDVPVVFARWAIRNVEEISVENDSEVLA